MDKGGQHQAFIMQISFIKSIYCRLISRDASETLPRATILCLIRQVQRRLISPFFIIYSSLPSTVGSVMAR